MAIRTKKLQRQNGPRLSRSDKWKRNPIPWLVLILISCGIAWQFVWNNFQEFTTKSGQINKFKDENTVMIEENKALNISLNEIEIEFNKLAEETKAKEEQIFPKIISVRKIIKVLEVFSLILAEDIEEFSLESVNFSTSTKSEEQDYSKLSTNIRIIGTKEHINNFVDFLRTSELPIHIEEHAKNADEFRLLDIRFLKQNLLPLATLDSIRISQHKSSNSSIENLLSVELKVNFYSH